MTKVIAGLRAHKKLQAIVPLSCKPLCRHVRPSQEVTAELLHAYKAAGQCSAEGGGRGSMHASRSDLQPLA